MTSEAAVQAAVRLEYARRGYRLFRNNTGVLKRTEPTLITAAHVGQTLDVAPPHAQPVRFGLNNDSAAVNAASKPSDLIGWKAELVTPAMVGEVIARFTSLEIKPPGWRLVPSDKRGQAQKAWIDLVVSDGGEGRFITGVDDQ